MLHEYVAYKCSFSRANFELINFGGFWLFLVSTREKNLNFGDFQASVFVKICWTTNLLQNVVAWILLVDCGVFCIAVVVVLVVGWLVVVVLHALDHLIHELAVALDLILEPIQARVCFFSFSLRRVALYTALEDFPLLCGV